MTIQSVCTAIAAVTNGLTAVVSVTETLTVTAFDPPPAKLDTGELPALVIYTGQATHDWEAYGDELGVERRIYRVRVAVLPEGQATPELRETHCRPLINAVRDRLASYSTLGGAKVKTVVSGDSGPMMLTEYSAIGFEVQLSVTETFARTAAPGE